MHARKRLETIYAMQVAKIGDPHEKSMIFVHQFRILKKPSGVVRAGSAALSKRKNEEMHVCPPCL